MNFSCFRHMASRRWLLLLMLWLRMVKSEFLKQRFASVRNWNSVVIPKDGVYLISVIADPSGGCVLTLQVSCKCHEAERFILIAIADRIYSHAEVAAGLKKNDELFMKINGEFEAASSLSVVYVAELNSFYLTAKNMRWTDRSPVTYTNMLMPIGWTSVKPVDKQTTFSLSTTGMYWVTARPNPYPGNPVTLKVKIGSKILFTVYSEKAKSVSASGAFHLKKYDTIWMVTQGGVTYEPQTLLSAVYLAGNKKPNSYPFEHLAFTAKYDKPLHSAAKGVLQFKSVLADYGYMYIDGYTEIR